MSFRKEVTETKIKNPQLKWQRTKLKSAKYFADRTPRQINNYKNLKAELNKPYLSSSEADIVAFTETWLHSDVTSEEIFSVLRKDRKFDVTGQRCGGGVLVAFKEHIKYEDVNVDILDASFPSIDVILSKYQLFYKQQLVKELIPGEMRMDDTLLSSPIDIVNGFAKYFESTFCEPSERSSDAILDVQHFLLVKIDTGQLAADALNLLTAKPTHAFSDSDSDSQDDRRPRIVRERNDLFETLDDVEFKRRFRLTKRTFLRLECLLCNLQKARDNRNHPVSKRNQILICLRFFASPFQHSR
nr:unnamed protein product [Callosobruchus analis]